MRVSIFPLIVLLVGTPVARSADRPPWAGLLTVPPMAAPTMDGRLTAATQWQSTCQITGWADSVLGVANNDGTTVSVGHASNVLYVLFRCPIPEKFRFNKVVYASIPLRMTARERDGDILQDDYVGVCLTPPGSRDVYFLGVNGAGITRDSRNGDVSWNGQWQVHQSRDDYLWTVEFAIPLAQFRGAAVGDPAWGVNFKHGARQLEMLDSVWAYRAAQVCPMAQMRLSPRAIAVTLTTFGNLSEGSLAMKGQIANLSAEAFEGTAEASIRDLAGGTPPVFGPDKCVFSLKPGEKKQLAAKYDAAGPLCGEFLLSVKDRHETVLFDYGLPLVFARETSLETRFIPTPAILQIVLDLGSSANLKKISGGRVKVTSRETKQEVLSQALPAFQSSISISDLDCSRLPPGRYEAAVELGKGTTSAVLKDVFVKEPKPEWLDNTIGISEKVPAPWTPLKTADRSVACWGRQYTFGAAGFPSQINVLGRDILAGPVRVVVKSGGRTEILPDGSFQMTEKKDARVAMTSVSHAGGLKIAADTWMEFDGFVWNTITVQSESAAAVDGLAIEMPLKKEYATLWWHPDIGAGLLDSRMGAPPRRPSASEPLNFLRLGDEEHGIQFFYEALDDWNPLPGRGQELIPGEKEYVLRYNIIGRPTKLEKPRQFALGYMALPCRPRSGLFRRIDVNSMWSATAAKPLDKKYLERANWIFQTSNIYDMGASRYESNYFNFWNRAVYDRDCLRKFKETVVDPAWKDFKNTFCQYYQACTIDANTPEYRRYRFEWKATPGNAPSVPPDPKTRDKVVPGCVCHQSRSYRDFFLWYLDKTVRYLSDNGKIPVHGYQDCGGHPWCANTLHGCPAKGHYPVLANREFAKRAYIMFKSISPLNQMYHHTGGQSAMDMYAFCDVMIEGEQFTAGYLAAMVNDPRLPKDYTKILNLDRCRAQLQPYAWGPDRIYLWQFWQWTLSEPDEARGARGHLWGLQLLHDAPVWACRTPLCVGRAFGELTWDDQVEFVPYWRKRTGIAVSAPVGPVVASAWRRGNGNLLAIVMNDSDRTAQGRLTIDFARFGFKSGEIQCRDYGGVGLGYPNALFSYDEKTKQPIDPQRLPVRDRVVQPGVAVPVEISQHSFKLFRFHQ